MSQAKTVERLSRARLIKWKILFGMTIYYSLFRPSCRTFNNAFFSVSWAFPSYSRPVYHQRTTFFSSKISLWQRHVIRPARLTIRVGQSRQQSTASSSDRAFFPSEMMDFNSSIQLSPECHLTISHTDFATHVQVNMVDQSSYNDTVTVQQAVQSILDLLRDSNDTRFQKTRITELTAEQLIRLGAVWFLPAKDTVTFFHYLDDPSRRGVKPTRLGEELLFSGDREVGYCLPLLQDGDYLRVHHDPRRFRQVYRYDWSKHIGSPTGTDNLKTGPPNVSDSGEDDRTGVIVAANAEKGWMVIDKPSHVSVHPTVDNARENVAACLRLALTATQSGQDQTSSQHANDHGPVYVSTPQRLDQNTSGLLVVATSKSFANYYANLLHSKTRQQLLDHPQTNPAHSLPNATDTVSSKSQAIHKLYRCLVCLLPPERLETDHLSTSDVEDQQWSVQQAVSELTSFAESRRVMRHFLEPSIRAPKRFVLEPPPEAKIDESQPLSSWKESLLKIRQVGKVCALVGNKPGDTLSRSLWSRDRMPPGCQAVVELEIELLTGRTHQIRGQLSAAGFPLVGDAQYGGSLPHDVYPPDDVSLGSLDRLALQCCELEFLDPDVVQISKSGEASTYLRASSRRNLFRLDTAWWTQMIEDYHGETNLLSEKEKTTLASDIGLTEVIPMFSDKPPRPDLLPSRVSLSPGKNKYVLIRASHPDARVEWFVKSAAPNECGGPYHGNVAQDLREWIEAAGYSAKVTGGGRIDFDPQTNRATVYGFSYGFGRGDHERAASMIRDWSQDAIEAIVDASPDLY